MPIYDFECEQCGFRFEEMVPAGEKPEACPECGAARLRRLYSAPAPPAKLGTAGERRRRDERRGTERGGAMQRFKQQRERESSRGKGGR